MCGGSAGVSVRESVRPRVSGTAGRRPPRTVAPLRFDGRPRVFSGVNEAVIRERPLILPLDPAGLLVSLAALN